jgi:pSer/pThr/pTyr-binding forkhead associated (FHA) protein
MATLCLLSDDGRISVCWQLGDTPLAVGRDEVEADVVIPDGSLSRRHFVISRDPAGWILQDLQSANGTWVAGHRAVATRLQHHQCIVAGRSVFLFKEEDNVQPTAAAPWLVPEAVTPPPDLRPLAP